MLHVCLRTVSDEVTTKVMFSGVDALKKGVGFVV